MLLQKSDASGVMGGEGAPKEHSCIALMGASQVLPEISSKPDIPLHKYDSSSAAAQLTAQ